MIPAFLFQGSRGIWQPDEGYYVGTAVTMLDNGDLLIPRLGEDIFLEKPPMTYWGIMAGLKLFGHTEFAVRAFNALCYVATALAVGLLGYSLFGTRRDGIAASFVYATMVLPFVAANFVTPDTPLTLWATVSALFFWKSVEPNGRYVTSWEILMCTAVGLGFLCKGPAALIPCGGMFVFLAVRRQVVKYFFSAGALAGFVIFCFVGLGWYFYVSLKVPGAGSYFFDNQVWGRLISEKYNRNPGITGALIYLPVLTLGSLPWSAEWLKECGCLRSTVFKKSWWRDLPNHPEDLFQLTWYFVPLVIFCLASSKLGFYTLPLFPCAALATSQLWVKKIPAFSAVPMKERLKVFVRPTVLIGSWLLLLLAAKLALAYYPTRKDARVLWTQIHGYLPKGKYEIVTIDEHADGLLFYGAKEVENVTKSNTPYPTFSVPEHVMEELKDIPIENHPFLFLIREADDIAEVQKILTEAGIAFQTINLPYERSMLVCKLLNGQQEN